MGICERVQGSTERAVIEPAMLGAVAVQRPRDPQPTGAAAVPASPASSR